MSSERTAYRVVLTFTLVLLPLAARAQQQSKPEEPLRRSAIPQPSTPRGQTPAGPPRLADGISREQMWPAASAEEWKKPCLVQFQRTWEDALAIAKQTKKPILVCVNMDGEIASEHYAGVRYRNPEMAALYEPFVCVIASVYRHTPRDFDDDGKRILCPRFGSVTCGEHIAIEPFLFEKFMDGRRIAPRHICVETDDQLSETFDVYYTWDTASVFTMIRAGATERPPPVPLPRGDLPLAERVASRDLEDRNAVETAYVAGTAAAKKELLSAALKHKELDQVDLLRLALFGVDPDLARLARKALAQSQTEPAIDLIGEALRVPMEADEREALLGALGRLGQTFPRARTLLAVHRGLAGRSSTLDVGGWTKALAEPPATEVVDRTTLQTRVEYQASAAEANPRDAKARTELAETYMRLADDPQMPRPFARALVEDARRAATEAQALGVDDWRVHAALALAAQRSGDLKEAYARAEAAVAKKPADAQDQAAMQVLALFAEARQSAIWQAMRDKKDWPPQWLTDVNAAYSVLALHPYGTDAHVAAHVDFLVSLQAKSQAATALETGLARFPESWVLHDRFRTRVLADKGAKGLEPAYAERLARPGTPPNERWFAAYASLVAAEFMRRDRKPEQALECYGRAIAQYEQALAANPQTRDSCDHYVALALAGRARVALERGDLDAATADVLGSFQRRAEAAASLDGLNLSPADTAKMLRSRLEANKRTDLAERLKVAMDALDPRLLELPAYERDVPAASQPARRGRRR